PLSILITNFAPIMETDFDHPVYSKNVLEFVTVAREFCNWLEGTPNFERREFIDTGRKMLPLLYLKASVLPKTEEMLEDDFLEKFVSEEEYQQILNAVLAKMGPYNDYLEVFTADMQRSVEPLTATVSENLADIYQDIKDFLMSYRTAVTEIMNDALLELNQNFEEYWGQKLVNVLRALHNVAFSGENIDEDEDEEDPLNDKRNKEDWLISRMQKDWQQEHREDRE
ncbi:MAG: DUF5063 domain-containing protein, partial [Marinilabiliaceae bacterium]